MSKHGPVLFFWWNYLHAFQANLSPLPVGLCGVNLQQQRCCIRPKGKLLPENQTQSFVIFLEPLMMCQLPKNFCFWILSLLDASVVSPFPWQQPLCLGSCGEGFSCISLPCAEAGVGYPTSFNNPVLFPSRVCCPVSCWARADLRVGSVCAVLTAPSLAPSLSSGFALSWHTVAQAAGRRWWSWTGKGWCWHTGYRWYRRDAV